MMKNKTTKVPRGFIIVPKNPSVEMMDAAEDCFVRTYTGTYTADPVDIWNAMIKAHKKSLKKKPVTKD